MLACVLCVSRLGIQNGEVIQLHFFFMANVVQLESTSDLILSLILLEQRKWVYYTELYEWVQC